MLQVSHLYGNSLIIGTTTGLKLYEVNNGEINWKNPYVILEGLIPGLQPSPCGQFVSVHAYSDGTLLVFDMKLRKVVFSADLGSVNNDAQVSQDHILTVDKDDKWTLIPLVTSKLTKYLNSSPIMCPPNNFS